MMQIPDGPCAMIAQVECPDCHELITSQTRFGGHSFTLAQMREEYVPVHCRHCDFTWSLLGRTMFRLVQLDFTEWRAAA